MGFFLLAILLIAAGSGYESREEDDEFRYVSRYRDFAFEEEENDIIFGRKDRS